MINRNNYQLMEGYLKFKSEVEKKSPATISRMRSYLRHVLIFADDKPLHEYFSMEESLPDYLSKPKERGGKYNV